MRVDSGVALGFAVPSFYDSLLAKVIVWDETREAATERMLEALDDFELEGVDTLIPFHRRLLAQPAVAGRRHRPRPARATASGSS